eukprot:4082801-Amphidinium_carterae.2
MRRRAGENINHSVISVRRVRVQAVTSMITSMWDPCSKVRTNDASNRCMTSASPGGAATPAMCSKSPCDRVSTLANSSQHSMHRTTTSFTQWQIKTGVYQALVKWYSRRKHQFFHSSWLVGSSPATVSQSFLCS